MPVPHGFRFKRSCQASTRKNTNTKCCIAQRWWACTRLDISKCRDRIGSSASMFSDWQDIPAAPDAARKPNFWWPIRRDFLKDACCVFEFSFYSQQMEATQDIGVVILGAAGDRGRSALESLPKL